MFPRFYNFLLTGNPFSSCARAVYIGLTPLYRFGFQFTFSLSNLHAGFALSEGQGRLFEKSPLHPAKTLSVTVCVDVTVISVPHPTPKNTVTPSHTVTLPTVQLYHTPLVTPFTFIEDAVIVETFDTVCHAVPSFSFQSETFLPSCVRLF